MSSRHPFLLAPLFVIGLLTGCGGGAAPVVDPIPSVDSGDAGSSTEPHTDAFRVRFETTAGEFVVEVNPSWAPHGAARFRELVEQGLYDENRFFRVVPRFVVQWGINGDPTVSSQWRENTIPDDPPKASNTRGRITFATSGPDSRTSQVFVNFGDNSRLDGMGFAPFGEVVEGMDVVEKINGEYGESPDQGLIQNVGNAYLRESFPNLDYVQRATIEE